MELAQAVVNEEVFAKLKDEQRRDPGMTDDQMTRLGRRVVHSTTPQRDGAPLETVIIFLEAQELFEGEFSATPKRAAVLVEPSVNAEGPVY